MKFKEYSFTLLKLLGLSLSVLISSFVSAQEINFSGNWSPLYHEDGPDRIPGPPIGDYTALPLNAAGLLRAQSWDPNRISVVQELQCRPHGADYALRGLSHLRIEREIDPRTQQAIAFHTRMNAANMTRTIWLDGRDHPHADTPHTWGGFSTAHFENGMMVVYTTHLKASYHRRNGVPSSSERTFTEYWYIHENILTVVSVEDDLVFYTESLLRSQNWVVNPAMRITFNNCEYVVETPIGDDGQIVPHYLPGQNAFLTENAETYHLPLEGQQGGAETFYPEFREQLGEPLGDNRFCTLDCE